MNKTVNLTYDENYDFYIVLYMYTLLGLKKKYTINFEFVVVVNALNAEAIFVPIRN